MSLYHQLFAYGVGAFLAAVFAYAAERMRADERWLFTWVIGVVVIGFTGFPLGVADWSAVWNEAAILFALGGLLAVSWFRRSSALLGLVYLAHGASDVAHLVLDLSPANPTWIHEFCIPFDWLLGVYVLWRGRHWRRADRP